MYFFVGGLRRRFASVFFFGSLSFRNTPVPLRMCGFEGSLFNLVYYVASLYFICPVLSPAPSSSSTPLPLHYYLPLNHLIPSLSSPRSPWRSCTFTHVVLMKSPFSVLID